MIGSRLAHYEIIGHVGSGGMGEVYQATDSKLGRSVAIKLLPEGFCHDPERKARLEREARVLASLNHPNIAAIHGLEQSNGRTFLVMEMVPGQTLAERIQHGPLPVDEALGVAMQIADALEAAHDKGVVHRDLKPANIKITLDGKVKVLDFGLAKAIGGVMETETSRPSLSNSPTMNFAATNAGMILGTAAYMSPEQARGRDVDARSDIWSFAMVLYEMLTGKPAFDGETIVEILGGVLKADPDWLALPPATPPAIRSLLRRCLQKDRNRRLRDIADARFQIEEALNEPVSRVSDPVRKQRGWHLWIPAVVAAIIVTATGTSMYFRAAPADMPEMRLQIVTPPGVPTRFALSPDGRSVVFQATTEGKSQLWIRPLDSEVARPLAGTDSADFPFWSPDSRSVGFFADQKLKRIDVEGGTPRALADAPSGLGGAWNAEGIIVFAPSNTIPLYSVPATGGQAMEVTHIDSPLQAGHRFPDFLPDGRHFLFFVTGTPEVRGVYVGSLDSKEARRLLDADTRAEFAPPDVVLFMRQETLFGQRLNMDKLEAVDDPFPVAERLAGVDQDPVGTAFSVALSASESGLLAYRPATRQPRQLSWFDRSGTPIGTLGDSDPASLGIRSSPDGRIVALTRSITGNLDLWLLEGARGFLRRFTSDSAADIQPVWSPDGNTIAFASFRKGRYDIYQKALSGATEEVLYESLENKNINDWSSDGRFILYNTQNPKTARDLWALPLSDRKPFVVVQTAGEEAGGRFSPDGRWIAYSSDETGRSEIYLQPFPGPGRNLRVSSSGGTIPRWRRDGREIFYISPDNHLMAAPVTWLPGGSTVEVGTSVTLFPARTNQYDVSPDGQRFLINLPIGEAPTFPITIVLNWAARLKK